ncbi:DNA-binding protein [Pseudonocardia sp. Ae406_Ps2]|nr:DNA-binding protein [Pseudonocardia sp. Ae331_Ps2]OLM04987.1 DNA-binding protein [Pseudonocardia sp. Ae406_Ps2]OLM10186.1 DNA-binding protein [Pseudonocardia sp. Ae505_Ps2]OLM26558.1 DNA-binding protein [Pseudonocardia sp. Ae706_Ps2]
MEQGREVHPSEQVLEALASALDLDHIAAAHLYQLGLPRPGHAQPATEVSEGVRRLLDSLSAVPAFVLDPALDVLVANDLALALYSGFERFDNLLRMIFLDPAAATFYRDPDAAARGAVSHLRVASAPFPHDQHVTSRVREMQQRSAKFARLWERYEVAEKVSVDKVLQHREAGMLSLHYESLAISSARGLHLATYSATNEDTVAGLEALSRLPADGST